MDRLLGFGPGNQGSIPCGPISNDFKQVCIAYFMKEEEVAQETNILREKYLAMQSEKIRWKISVPHKLRFPLVWTAFFTMIGIIVQSIKKGDIMVLQFFWKNYFEWFASFSGFSSTSQAGADEFIPLLFGGWYYLFYTGGIISLLWAVIYTIIHAEISAEKKDLPV